MGDNENWVGRTVEITCMLLKANGRWRVLSLPAGDTVFMGRVGQGGKLLACTRENKLTLHALSFRHMLTTGTAKWVESPVEEAGVGQSEKPMLTATGG